MIDKIDIIVKPQFTVIGQMGQGLDSNSAVWIPPLWQEANSRFSEISHLAKMTSEGLIAGIWGAMSDVNERFERWSTEGKYLAGCEVIDDAEAPDGWVKWVIPSFRYIVVKCNQASYQETFNHILEAYFPHHEYTLAGAVQEFYQPQDQNGELSLLFPIEKL